MSMYYKLEYTWDLNYIAYNTVHVSSYFGPKNDDWCMSLNSGEKPYLVLYRSLPIRKVRVVGSIIIDYFSSSFQQLNLDNILDRGYKSIKAHLANGAGNIRQFKLEVSVHTCKLQESSVQTDIAVHNYLDSRKLNPICNIISNADDFGSLLFDMQAMYEKREQADFVLICNSVEIRVHKFILSARSPVLSRMLQHDMKETIDNKMVITDVDASVMEMLILFMYTNRVNEMSYSMALDLFSTAEKYEILGLKAVCERFLSLFLTTSNILEIIISADLHHGEELKQHAMNYIFEQFGNMKGTEDWKNFTKEHSYLAVEVLTYITEKTQWYGD